MFGGLSVGLSTPIALGVAAVATGVSTLIGGWLALALRSRIHLILGFSAGAIVAVALLELLPEAYRAGASTYGFDGLAGFAGLGFLGYLVLDRLLQVAVGPSSNSRGHLGAASLTTHSFMDGLAIGLGFQASTAIGLVVAAAVLAHDFSDGINTVNLSMAGANARVARRWLLADALAPAAGILVTVFVRFPGGVLAPALAVFSGAFLYIGAGRLIGESHARHPHLWTTLMTLLGFGVIYLAVSLSHA